MDAQGENAEQIEYWNGEAGAKWVAQQEHLDGQIGPLGLRAIDAAGLVAGERVLDVGCGCGATTLEIARRVGPKGGVTGVDLSEPMLARARARAHERGVDWVSFREADAQVYPFGSAEFDAVTSRFGVMFFSDPTAAFANLCRALAPGGRLAFVCWQGLDRNPWMRVPLLAAAQHVELPQPPAPEDPGPFSFADRNRVLRILEHAGFVEASLLSVEDSLVVGGAGTLEESVDFLMQIGPTSRVLADAGSDQRSRVRQAILEALAPHATVAGVRMECAAWIATARRS